MDQYTKNALWDYWRRGGDEEVIIDDELSNPGDDNLMKENEIAQIFRIDTDIFHFETPLCKAFKEFNYLLKIDYDVLIKDILGFKTYKEYTDDWIYEWNNGIPWVDEKSWIDKGVWTEPTDNINHECNSIRYQDYEWYDTLEDSDLKNEALINKCILEESMNVEEELRTISDDVAQKNKEWFDEHELMEDDNDDIDDLEDYLI
ncbi:hypothetical protein Tco_1456305 [Tanacetum coccineum]